MGQTNRIWDGPPPRAGSSARGGRSVRWSGADRCAAGCAERRPGWRRPVLAYDPSDGRLNDVIAAIDPPAREAYLAAPLIAEGRGLHSGRTSSGSPSSRRAASGRCASTGTRSRRAGSRRVQGLREPDGDADDDVRGRAGRAGLAAL